MRENMKWWWWRWMEKMKIKKISKYSLYLLGDIIDDVHSINLSFYNWIPLEWIPIVANWIWSISIKRKVSIERSRFLLWNENDFSRQRNPSTSNNIAVMFQYHGNRTHSGPIPNTIHLFFFSFIYFLCQTKKPKNFVVDLITSVYKWPQIQIFQLFIPCIDSEKTWWIHYCRIINGHGYCRTTCNESIGSSCWQSIDHQ